MPYSTASAQRPNAQINITPLVDVMLVLLVIFMIAMPVISHPIVVNLPQTARPDSEPIDPPLPIRLRIDGAGQVYWNDALTPISALQNLMQAEVQRAPANPPTLQIDSSDEAEYDVLAKVLAAAKNADLQRIGFVQK